MGTDISKTNHNITKQMDIFHILKDYVSLVYELIKANYLFSKMLNN